MVTGLVVTGLRGTVPRAAVFPRGHAIARPAVPRAAVPRAAIGLARESWRAVRAGRAASWSARVGGAPWWERRFSEARPGSLARPGTFVTLVPVFTRASAVAWPGPGVGCRLPAPAP